MDNLVRYNSDDMYYPYDMEYPECQIITIDTNIYPFLTTEPTDTHGFTNNLLRFIYPDSYKPDINHFPVIMGSGTLPTTNTINYSLKMTLVLNIFFLGVLKDLCNIYVMNNIWYFILIIRVV